MLPSVVEKCLGSTRVSARAGFCRPSHGRAHPFANNLPSQAGTRTKAIELCLLYVECEEDKGEGVIVRCSFPRFNPPAPS